EDRTIFLVEVTQNGLFNIENVPEGEMDPLLGIGCPSILFPYLREAVSDLTTRAGFPPLMLQPINFEAIYMQQRQQAEEQAANAQTTH
ncbi:MAG: protein-export chaperone SecB, partial [Iodobacter sp.]